MTQHNKETIKPKASSLEKSHSLHILLVEDEPTHVAVMNHIIQSANPYAVVKVVGSLKEYRSIIAKSMPDIALIDMYLPDGKALEVLTSPLEAGSFPIVIMTSSGDEKIAVKALKAGALDYIVKSTETFKEMPHTIERALREWKLVQERKQAEEELRESELRFHSFYENVAIGLYRTTPAGKILLANRALVKMLGYSSFEKLAEINIAKAGFAQPSQRKEFLKKIETENEVKDFESTWVCQDGSLVIVRESARAIRDSQGKTLYYDGAVEDITECRLAEAASRHAEDTLKESEEKFKYIFDHSVVGKSITFPSGDINVNKAFCEMVGYTKEELQHKKWQDITYPDDVELTQRAMDLLISDKQDSARFVKRFIHKNGTIVWADIGSSLRCDNDGKPLYFMTTLIDITELKHAEEVQRENDARYRALVEFSPDAITQSDLNGKILMCNLQTALLHGYERPEELIGTSVFNLFSPNELERAKINLQKTLKGGIIKNAEYHFLKKDGSQFQAELSAALIADTDGKPASFIAMTRDITERKRVEEALRENEEKFRAAFENAPMGMSMILPDGQYLAVNSALCRMFGYSQDELLAGTINKITHPDDVERGNQWIRKMISGDRSEPEFEKRYIHKDGHIVWGLVRAEWIKDNAGAAKMSVVHIMDITERKRVEEQLQASEERMRAIVEGTPHLFFYTQDGNANTTYVSPTVEQITGYKTEIWQKRKDWFITDTKFNQIAIEKTAAHLRGEFIEEPVILEVCHANGNPILLEVYEYPILQKGKIIGLQGVAHDITERKQTEEALRQMQKLEGLGTLAGGIAHDFNNILGIILAYITSLKMSKGDPKKLDLVIETITKAVDRGKRLVQQVLTFARKTETAFGAVNVNEVVMEIMAMIFETFPKNFTYAQNFDKTIPYINADHSQLYQTLLNLCVNARDAMPKGGNLTINTHMVSVANLRAQHPDADASSYVCIEVSDTGEGMTEEIQKRIFEPFFTTKGIGKGTGLGLAVVFGIIQAHKGFIEIKSELGKGTTFHLYLPVSKVAEPIIEKEEETLEEIPGGTETLLIVEDEELLLTSLQTVLAGKGYKVLSAGDGLTALKIYTEKKNDISLVLTDLGLPNISGLEVCQRIKKINPDEHIILSTGYLDPEMRAELLKTGIEHFLFKPYEFKKALKVVREVIDKK